MHDRPILKESILDFLFNSVVAMADRAGSFVMRQTESAVAGISGMFSDSVSGIASTFSLGGGAVERGAAPEISPPSRSQEQAVSITASPVSQYDVNPAELGGFPPPTFGGGAQRSGGMSV